MVVGRLSAQNFVVDLADGAAAIGESGAKGIGRVEAATDGDAVVRRGVVGEDGFTFVTPTAENAFDAAEFAVVDDEFVGIGKDASVAGAFEGAEGIGFVPAVFEAKNLGDEFGVHESAGTGFNGEIVFAARSAFLFDAQAHGVDFLFPVVGVGRRAFGRRI